MGTTLLDIVAQSLMNDGVTQYPDAKIYRAATMLKPQDRPTVPVIPTDPDPAKHPIFRVSNPGAFSDIHVNDDKSISARGPISVNNKSTEYQEADPLLLASVLAHEAQHYKTGYPEKPAYQKAIDFLQGTRMRDSNYVKNLKRVADKHKDDE